MLHAVLLLALVLTGQAMAQGGGVAHRVSAGTTHVVLARDVGFMVDPSATMTAAEVGALGDSGVMKRVATAHIPMLRIDRNEAFWIRYDVRADAGAPREWMMELGRANVARMQLFARSPQGTWEAFPEAGSAVPFSSRPIAHRHFVFPVRIEPGALNAFLVRVQYAGPSTPQAAIWQPAALRATDTAIFGLFCLYFGLAGGMVLYNLLLYVAVRERAYLLYTACVACTAGSFAASTGLGAQFIWGEFTWWSSHCLSALYSAAMLFSALLVRQFLQTRDRVPNVDRVLRVLAWVCAAGFAASLALPTNLSAMIVVPAAIVLMMVIPGVSLHGALRRWPGARFFAAAWCSLYVGVLLAVGRTFALFEDNLLTENSLAISSAFEMILLSLALADRINDERRQKEEAQARAVDARRVGMAEIATNVLHNVGNTLNSVNVSAELIRSRLANSRSGGLARAVGLMDAQGDDLPRFLRDDERGRMLPGYLRELSGALQREREEMLDHVANLAGNIDHIKRVVATQQAYAGASIVTERIDVGDLIDDALRIAAASSGDGRVAMERVVAPLPPLRLDKTRALQILVNLLANAVQAVAQGLAQGTTTAPRVTVSAAAEGERLRIRVQDNGCGIDRANIARIFQHGWTTRAGGHGFGLHSCANAAEEMGGSLTAQSDGPGTGAIFTLDLPRVEAAR
ncbi:sensor histidine kinase [Ramlibacter sp.]|uniref:sensor histidine kinase n=1 Tax=Ramlibacter sp. TaxID=1917967 RepID=UPI003D0EB1BE